MPAHTSMNAAELETFFNANEGRRAWADSLYEVVLGDSHGIHWVAANGDGTAWTPSSFAGETELIKISDEVTPMRYAAPVPGMNGAYYKGAVILPVTSVGVSGSLGHMHNIALLYTPPSYDIKPIGAFLRVYCGIWHNSAAGDNGWYAPVGGSMVVPDLAGAIFQIGETGKPATTMLHHNQLNRGLGFFFNLTDAGSSYGEANVGAEHQINLQTICSLYKCKMYATIHLVYPWQPGTVLSPYMDWATSTPDPIVVSGSESSQQTVNIKRAGNSAVIFRHKVKILVETEASNASFDPVQNTSNILGTGTTQYTHNWQKSIFSNFPNNQTIRGKVQLFTYMPDSDSCLNELDGEGNPIPVETDFEVALAVTEDVTPTAGNLSAALIRNGFAIDNVYVQGVSGVSLTLSGWSCKLNAQPKYCVICYYGGVIRAEWPRASGNPMTSATVNIDTLDRFGELTFTAYIEDSRGFVSPPKDVTINVQRYTPPAIPTCTLYRADANGTPNEMTGVYAIMNATANAASIGNANRITRMRVAYAEYGPNIDWDNATYQTITPGSDAVVASDCDPGKIYRFRIEATDTVGNTVVRYKTLKTAAYTLHLRKGGNGIGIGQVAHQQNALTIADDWEFFVYGDRLLNLVAPIGCVRMFGRVEGQPDTDPADVYPGTVWERITDRYLVAASSPDSANQRYIGGNEGGSDEIYLFPINIPELPVETEYGGYAYNSGTATPPNKNKGFGGLHQGWDNAGTGVGEWGGDDYLAGAIANKGNTSPTPVRFAPPYYVVDIWKRIL